MSSSPLIEGFLLGSIAALVPGLHPMIFGRIDLFALGIAYGVFTGLSILLAREGIFHPETAGERSIDSVDILKGLVLGLLLLPVAYVFYSVELPRVIILIVLLLGAFLLGRRDPLIFLLSGMLGFVVLKAPVNVTQPLASGFLYLFGLWFLLGKADEKPRKEDWKGGVLSSLLTAYFPALPPSTWSYILGNGSVSVAAALSPIFSLVTLLHGKTRSAMTAYIPTTDPTIVILVGLAYLLSLGIVLSLAEVLRLQRLWLPREVGLGVIVGHAAAFGVGNVLLLLASLGLLLTRRKIAPSTLFGFIIVPTIFYYA